jgi:hypothetical protein
VDVNKKPSGSGHSMNKKLKTAFACHLLAVIVVAAFGVTYLLRPEFMPYHAVAVGTPWPDVSPGFRALVLGLMRVVGGACIAVVVLELGLLLVPFRQGARWARWLVPAGGLAICAGALYGMSLVARGTPATPPWSGPVAATVLFALGLLLSIEGRKR